MFSSTPLKPLVWSGLARAWHLEQSKKKAKVMFAGVGIANASDLNLPITKQSDYIINYEGAKIIS